MSFEKDIYKKLIKSVIQSRNDSQLRSAELLFYYFTDCRFLEQTYAVNRILANIRNADEGMWPMTCNGRICGGNAGPAIKFFVDPWIIRILRNEDCMPADKLVEPPVLYYCKMCLHTMFLINPTLARTMEQKSYNVVDLKTIHTTCEAGECTKVAKFITFGQSNNDNGRNTPSRNNVMITSGENTGFFSSNSGFSNANSSASPNGSNTHFLCANCFSDYQSKYIKRNFISADLHYINFPNVETVCNSGLQLSYFQLSQKLNSELLTVLQSSHAQLLMETSIKVSSDSSSIFKNHQNEGFFEYENEIKSGMQFQLTKAASQSIIVEDFEKGAGSYLDKSGVQKPTSQIPRPGNLSTDKRAVSRVPSMDVFTAGKARTKAILAHTYSDESLGNKNTRLATMAASSLIIYCQPRLVKINYSSPMYCHFTDLVHIIVQLYEHLSFTNSRETNEIIDNLRMNCYQPWLEEVIKYYPKDFIECVIPMKISNVGIPNSTSRVSAQISILKNMSITGVLSSFIINEIAPFWIGYLQNNLDTVTAGSYLNLHSQNVISHFAFINTKRYYYDEIIQWIEFFSAHAVQVPATVLQLYEFNMIQNFRGRKKEDFKMKTNNNYNNFNKKQSQESFDISLPIYKPGMVPVWLQEILNEKFMSFQFTTDNFVTDMLGLETGNVEERCPVIPSYEEDDVKNEPAHYFISLCAKFLGSVHSQLKLRSKEFTINLDIYFLIAAQFELFETVKIEESLDQCETVLVSWLENANKVLSYKINLPDGSNFNDHDILDIIRKSVRYVDACKVYVNIVAGMLKIVETLMVHRWDLKMAAKLSYRKPKPKCSRRFSHTKIDHLNDHQEKHRPKLSQKNSSTSKTVHKQDAVGEYWSIDYMVNLYLPTILKSASILHSDVSQICTELVLNYLVETANSDSDVNGIIVFFSKRLVNSNEETQRMESIMSLSAILMCMKPRGQLNKQNVASTVTFLISIFLDVYQNGSPEEQIKAKTVMNTFSSESLQAICTCLDMQYIHCVGDRCLILEMVYLLHTYRPDGELLNWRFFWKILSRAEEEWLNSSTNGFEQESSFKNAAFADHLDKSFDDSTEEFDFYPVPASPYQSLFDSKHGDQSGNHHNNHHQHQNNHQNHASNHHNTHHSHQPVNHHIFDQNERHPEKTTRKNKSQAIEVLEISKILGLNEHNCNNSRQTQSTIAFEIFSNLGKYMAGRACRDFFTLQTNHHNFNQFQEKFYSLMTFKSGTTLKNGLILAQPFIVRSSIAVKAFVREMKNILDSNILLSKTMLPFFLNLLKRIPEPQNEVIPQNVNQASTVKNGTVSPNFANFGRKGSNINAGGRSKTSFLEAELENKRIRPEFEVKRTDLDKNSYVKVEDNAGQLISGIIVNTLASQSATSMGVNSGNLIAKIKTDDQPNINAGNNSIHVKDQTSLLLTAPGVDQSSTLRPSETKWAGINDTYFPEYGLENMSQKLRVDWLSAVNVLFYKYSVDDNTHKSDYLHLLYVCLSTIVSRKHNNCQTNQQNFQQNDVINGVSVNDNSALNRGYSTVSQNPFQNQSFIENGQSLGYHDQAMIEGRPYRPVAWQYECRICGKSTYVFDDTTLSLALTNVCTFIRNSPKQVGATFILRTLITISEELSVDSEFKSKAPYFLLTCQQMLTVIINSTIENDMIGYIFRCPMIRINSLIKALVNEFSKRKVSSEKSGRRGSKMENKSNINEFFSDRNDSVTKTFVKRKATASNSKLDEFGNGKKKGGGLNSGQLAHICGEIVAWWTW